jgi:hypothetical protein
MHGVCRGLSGPRALTGHHHLPYHGITNPFEARWNSWVAPAMGTTLSRLANLFTPALNVPLPPICLYRGRQLTCCRPRSLAPEARNGV